MTDATRREVLEVLAEISAYCPDMRFGQLIANLSVAARGAAVESIWDVEDEELLAEARQELESLRTRSASVA